MCMHTELNVCVYIYIYVYLNLYLYLYFYLYLNLYSYLYSYLLIFIYMYIYVHIYIYIYPFGVVVYLRHSLSLSNLSIRNCNIVYLLHIRELSYHISRLTSNYREKKCKFKG